MLHPPCAGAIRYGALRTWPTRTAIGIKSNRIGSGELLNLPFQSSPLSGHYECDYRRCDAVTWAEYYRVPFIEPKPLPEDHRLMARVCHVAGIPTFQSRVSDAMQPL
jgi:hypothetical protein